MTTDSLTIHALRSGMALQLARFVQRDGASQSAAAKRLGIPQPTLSKIMRGQVDSLSLELLIRIAVRAGLPFVLQTGKEPMEAGVFVSAPSSTGSAVGRLHCSGEDEGAQAALSTVVRRRKPPERLEALATHSHALSEERVAGTAVRSRRSDR